MSNNNTSSPNSTAHLSPEEKLAQSRAALQQALFPPKKAKPSAFAALRSLWSTRKKTAETEEDHRPETNLNEAVGSIPTAPTTGEADAANEADDNADNPTAKSVAVNKSAADGHAPRPTAARRSFAAAVGSTSSTKSSAKDFISPTLYAAGEVVLDSLKSSWQKHPLNMTLQIAYPLCKRQIRKQPLQALAIAAALGMLVVWLKPLYWRRSQTLLKASAGQAAKLGATSLIYSASSLLKRLSQ